jgi:hypothetical protein
VADVLHQRVDGEQTLFSLKTKEYVCEIAKIFVCVISLGFILVTFVS